MLKVTIVKIPGSHFSGHQIVIEFHEWGAYWTFKPLKTSSDFSCVTFEIHSPFITCLELLISDKSIAFNHFIKIVVLQCTLTLKTLCWALTYKYFLFFQRYCMSACVQGFVRAVAGHTLLMCCVRCHKSPMNPLCS